MVPVEGRRYNTAGYPQLVETDRERERERESAPVSSAVFDWVRGLNSGKDSAQTAHQEERRNASEEWLSEAIRSSAGDGSLVYTWGRGGGGG